MKPVHEGLFELRGDGSIDLVGGYSPASDLYHFPLLDTCPYTGATDVQRVLLSRAATLWAWTAVTATPPGYRGTVPYGFGIVELTRERLRVVTRLSHTDPARLEFGQPMTLVAHELIDGVVTWAFA
ncbi:MAG: Zn-ribbon domain-containing OB-fold protein [Actinomycetota bacterium]